VDLPVGMPDDIFQELQAVQIRGNPLRISRAAQSPRESGSPVHAPREERPPHRKPGGFKPGGFKPGGFKAGGFKPGGPRKPHRKGPKP
jgi:ATP-dependent RNA helicase DeaD